MSSSERKPVRLFEITSPDGKKRKVNAFLTKKSDGEELLFINVFEAYKTKVSREFKQSISQIALSPDERFTIAEHLEFDTPYSVTKHSHTLSIRRSDGGAVITHSTRYSPDTEVKIDSEQVNTIVKGLKSE